jgi:hypothetical protein
MQSVMINPSRKSAAPRGNVENHTMEPGTFASRKFKKLLRHRHNA